MVNCSWILCPEMILSNTSRSKAFSSRKTRQNVMVCIMRELDYNGGRGGEFDPCNNGHYLVP